MQYVSVCPYIEKELHPSGPRALPLSIDLRCFMALQHNEYAPNKLAWDLFVSLTLSVVSNGVIATVQACVHSYENLVSRECEVFKT